MPFTRRSFRRQRRRFLIAMFVSVLASLAAGTFAAEPKVAEPKPVVSLIVDYGDGVAVHFTELKWKPGMTVLDALSATSGLRRGVKFSQRGSGSSALVTKIDDLANQGDGKNWLYSVNDKPGEKSAGIQELRAGDAVLWKFKVYDYNQ
jgi:hypothetical protein